MQHVAVAHINLARGFRGGERQTLNLVEGCQQAGLSQVLVCRAGSELAQRARAGGHAVHEVRHPLLGHVGVPRALVHHVHEARGLYWAVIEHLWRKTPYMITRRIPNPVSGSWVNRYAYDHAAALVGVSRDVSARLKARVGRPVDTILDSCTPLTTDAQRVQSLRHAWGGGPVIGHVGALFDHHKGQSVLIEAFRLVRQALPDARLVLVGEGDDRARFEQLAAGDPDIIFAGYQQDIGNWLAAFDLLAFPSREEGLGSSVLDAMLLGIPAIVANVGGLPELADAGQRAWLLDGHDPQRWADAIVQAWRDPARRTAVAREALAFARSNDIAAMTRQYTALYAGIMAGFAQPPSAASV